MHCSAPRVNGLVRPGGINYTLSRELQHSNETHESVSELTHTHTELNTKDLIRKSDDGEKHAENYCDF